MRNCFKSFLAWFRFTWSVSDKSALQVGRRDCAAHPWAQGERDRCAGPFPRARRDIQSAPQCHRLARCRRRTRTRPRSGCCPRQSRGIWGPLHGVPMTIKESYNVAGSPTTWGDPKLKDNVTTTSALAVERLKKAGVVLFGKTNVPLMLGDNQSYNAIYGTTNNPWDLSRTPGGSSGGSAAAMGRRLRRARSAANWQLDRGPAHFCGAFASNRPGRRGPKSRPADSFRRFRSLRISALWPAAPKTSRSRSSHGRPRRDRRHRVEVGLPAGNGLRSRIFASP